MEDGERSNPFFRPRVQAPEMPPLEFEVWRDWVHQRSGLYFTPTRQHFLQQRLWDRMCLRRMRSYREYYHHVAYNPDGEGEWQELLELLVNRETGFFRHQPSFDALVDAVLPNLMQDKRRWGVSTIAMWSAGCSTGQEAYSLAMAFLEMVEPASPRREGDAVPLSPVQGAGVGGWQVKVCGSDISPRALERARRGRYSTFEVRFMPELYRARYLVPQEDGRHGVSHQVAERVRELVQFGYTNLTDLATYWVSAQDVIFCQNVLIYFQPESRVELVRRLCQRLNPGGYLFLAPAEVVGLRLPGVEPARLADALVYRRTP